MNGFAELYDHLDAARGTTAKVNALIGWFRAAPPADAAWSVYFLTGRRLKRLVPASHLRRMLQQRLGLPEWLVEDAYATVGDLAETVALLLDSQVLDLQDEEPRTVPESLAEFVEHHLHPLRDLDDDARDAAIRADWSALLRGAGQLSESGTPSESGQPQESSSRSRQLFVYCKLLTGALRVGVSQGLVVRALAEVSGLSRPVIQHRLMGDWQPTEAWFRHLLDPDTRDEDDSRPYPFYLASPLPGGQPDELEGGPESWRAEWKWDGIRAQAVRRGGQLFLWSRGEELLTDRFPELHDELAALPDGCVLDGEILAWRDGAPLPFATLQRRITRRKVGPKLLADAPTAFVAYDLLELGGRDLREQPFDHRRDRLIELLGTEHPPPPTPSADPSPDSSPDSSPTRLGVSQLVPFTSWPELTAQRESARSLQTEGLMLKRAASVYGTGRTRGDWWKWKVDPFAVDAVLIYAQAGHGRRASLYSDYTFAVWDETRQPEPQLVPIAKAYSGLTADELQSVDRWIRKHTIERFGPVRSVNPELVFELHFEGIQASPRHKSGVALRFPRINRWRHDKTAADADRLATLRDLIADLQ